MQYPFKLEGFEDHQLVLEAGNFFSGPRLLIDGQPAPKGPKAGQLLLLRSDGAEKVIQLRSLMFVDPIPQLVVDGKIVQVVEPFKWYHFLWAGWPLFLLLIGGALGGALGAAATFINVRVLRSDMSGVLRFVFTALISVAAILGWLVIGTMISLIFQ
jgi:hypothetical protein